MKLESLHDLFVHELQDLYSAENQLLEALPEMAAAAQSAELKSAFQRHWEETKGQVKRLEDVFRELEESPGDETCMGMQGLIEEGSDLIDEDADPTVKDAGLIVAAQKVEHYEIAAYGSCCVFAETLGFDRVKQLLKETLAEEEATDKKLSHLAESVINVQAAIK
jgi:ferritin-like metal-binding protein YciE